MQIKSKNIYLKRYLREESYPLLLEWFHDLEVMRYIGWVKKGLALKNIQELKEFISELENGIIFGIYSVDDKFIGYTTLSDFKGKDECEFGIFILDRNYQGKGLGMKVTKLMLGYAFDDLEIGKVILSTSEFHKKAIELYEQAGFKKIKLIPNDRTIYHNGQWVLSGTFEMEIGREDFLKQK